MARPRKFRQIEHFPDMLNFVPTKEVNVDSLKNVLKLEELEAIRLKDLEGLEQSECAEKMQISRPTFRRILISAREKIADSLINGKAISIDAESYVPLEGRGLRRGSRNGKCKGQGRCKGQNI